MKYWTRYEMPLEGQDMLAELIRNRCKEKRKERDKRLN
jgi:hypothetical protein